MTELSKYEEQLQRVKRWYNRFKEIDEAKEHTRNSEYYQDEVYAFFVNCYHLKDWLMQDDTVKIPTKKQKIEQFIENNDCMKLCADVCNGIKHLELNTIRTGIQPEFEGRKFELELGPKGTFLGVKYNIITATGNKDAFELATECMEKWQEFTEKI